MAQPDSPVPAEGEQLSETARKLLGTVVAGRYKVSRLLGEGGMGAVFLVEHNVIRKRMALKVLNTALSTNPEMVARFEREGLAAAHIDHPNVVAATDSGRTDDGSLFLVLEYLDGTSLRDVLAFGAFPAPRALHIVRQITSALIRAHSLGIVHRDLKPENVMLVAREDEGDVVKILDFGLAKLSVEALLPPGTTIPGNEALTKYGAIFGTPVYMAPEQAAGADVDQRSDLYALGILIYELLTGQVPFDAEDPGSILRMHLVAKVPPMHTRALGRKIPASLETLVQKLLEKQPDRRYDSARSLLDAVDAIIAAEGLQYDPKVARGLYPSPKATGAMLAVPSTTAERPALDNRPTVMAPEDLPKLAFAGTDPAQAGQGGPGAQGRQSDVSLAKTLASLNLVLESNPLGGPADEAADGGDKPKAASGDQKAPALRAPSVVDLAILKPDNASPGMLTPAPPPTLGERLKDASKDGVSWWRGSGWPTTRSFLQRVWAWLRTNVPVYWAGLLAFVRARLPEKHRGIGQTTLGLICGAGLLVPLVVLVVVLSRGDGSASTPTVAPLEGYATDQEMARGVDKGPAVLEGLANKYPTDLRVHRALVRAYAAKQNHGAALRSLVPLLRLDPGAASDDDIGKIVSAAALLPETSDRAFELLETSLGEHGVEILLDMADRTTIEPWRGKVAASIGHVRQGASKATLVLIDLRQATKCENKRPLLARAALYGDQRALDHLVQVQAQKNGCGPGGQADCWNCLRHGSELQNTINAIAKHR